MAKALNEGIKLSEGEGDNGTRHLLEELLKDTEEDHIFWLESQLKLVSTLGSTSTLRSNSNLRSNYNLRSSSR